MIGATVSKSLRLAAVLALSLAAAACATLGGGPEAGRDRAGAAAAGARLMPEQMRGGAFVLQTYGRFGAPGQPVRVYIEGDGLAWATRTRLSRDPTPRDPLALDLAAADPAANVLYVARPCQYVGVPENPRCTPALWSSHRFSDDVVAATDAVIEAWLRRHSAAGGIELVGYSGGAAVAALVAARRSDVRSLRTVAGNLDHEVVNRHHRVSPLTGSLNAADVAQRLAAVPQIHFIGGSDRIVPPSAAQSYAARSGTTRCVGIEPVAGADHTDGWRERWPALLRRPMPC